MKAVFIEVRKTKMQTMREWENKNIVLLLLMQNNLGANDCFDM